MGYENIIYEKKGRIVKLTLNRPQALNALSGALLDDLEAGLLQAEQDKGVSVVIIKGAGRAFCAGYDINPATGGMYARWTVMGDLFRLQATCRKLNTIWDLHKPVIAQVHGYCYAGGTDLIGQCDIVIAAENAVFGYPAIRRLGGGVMTNLYPYKVGPQWAKLLLFTGDSISGKLAERIGFIAKAVPEDKLEEEVDKLVQRIAMVDPEILAVNKAAVNRVYELMGMRNMLNIGLELDAIAHCTETVANFKKMAKKQGLKAALAASEAPFKELPKAFYDVERNL